MRRLLLSFGYFLGLSFLAGCTQLIVKQPMARFLSPTEEPTQFLGSTDVIEQSLIPSETGATINYFTSKVTMPMLGVATKHVYGFGMPSATGGVIGVGLRKSLLPDDSSLALLVNSDVALGGTDKTSDSTQPGVLVASINAGLSLGWKVHPHFLVYLGGAAQASSNTSRYLQKFGCTGAANCLGEKLVSESSNFASNALGLGLDILLPTMLPYTISVKASNTQWNDSRTSANTDMLYQAVFTGPLQ